MTMLHVSKTSVLVLLPVLCSGCVSTYPFVKDEKQAYIKADSSLFFCNGKAKYRVGNRGLETAAPIPAGDRITVGASMSFSGYNVTYSCLPSVSFVPQEKATYLLHGSVRGNRCYVEVVREDESKETGVAFEPSVGQSSCAVD